MLVVHIMGKPSVATRTLPQEATMTCIRSPLGRLPDDHPGLGDLGH